MNSSNSSTPPSSEGLEYKLTELTFREYEHHEAPYLRIISQPQRNFRFRYKSEMHGKHGCILSEESKKGEKAYPSVQLKNYRKAAIIKCELCQYNSEEEHPHRLQVEQSERPGVWGEVHPHSDNVLVFPEMSIICETKKDMGKFITNATKEKKNGNKKTVDGIDLNVVRLKFTAYDKLTNKLICPPVYSVPIFNMKSPKTNQLKICRMDRTTGTIRGNDEVYILTEKINKNDIQVRFVEVEDNRDVWVSDALFSETDVHHQYAIVFRTPPYRNIDTQHDVSVCVELLRPSDGGTSERVGFTYRPDPRSRRAHKKRKAEASVSLNSGSLHSDYIPRPLEELMSTSPLDEEYFDENMMNCANMIEIEDTTDYYEYLKPESARCADLGDALLHGDRDAPTLASSQPLAPSPLLTPGGRHESLSDITPDCLVKPLPSSELCDYDYCLSSGGLSILEDNANDEIKFRHLRPMKTDGVKKNEKFAIKTEIKEEALSEDEQTGKLVIEIKEEALSEDEQDTLYITKLMKKTSVEDGDHRPTLD